MSTEPDRQDPSLGQELRHWGRSSLEDLADELRTAMVFLAAMVPAGAVGYLVAGGVGAVVGALTGAVLVGVWLVVGAVWSIVQAVRRRRRRE